MTAELRTLRGTFESHTPDNHLFFPDISDKYLDRAVLRSYGVTLPNSPESIKRDYSLGGLRNHLGGIRSLRGCALGHLSVLIQLLGYWGYDLV